MKKPENIPTWNYPSSGIPIYETDSVPRIANTFEKGGAEGKDEPIDDPYGYSKYLSKPGINNKKLLQYISLEKEYPTTMQEAKLLAEATGIPEHRASVVAGQWALESGRGKHVGGDYNYFGIKSHSKSMRDKMSNYGIDISANEKTDTHEFKEGEKIQQKSSFLNFKNPLEAFIGYKAFIETNPRYKKALQSKSSLEYAMELKNAGYATSPSYVNKLKPLVASVDNSEMWNTVEDYVPEQNQAQTHTPKPSISANTISYKPDLNKLNKAMTDWKDKKYTPDSELYPQYNNAEVVSKKNPEIVDNLYLKPPKNVSFGKLPKLDF